jgi:hypothetical protein
LSRQQCHGFGTISVQSLHPCAGTASYSYLHRFVIA